MIGTKVKSALTTFICSPFSSTLIVHHLATELNAWENGILTENTALNRGSNDGRPPGVALPFNSHASSQY